MAHPRNATFPPGNKKLLGVFVRDNDGLHNPSIKALFLRGLGLMLNSHGCLLFGGRRFSPLTHSCALRIPHEHLVSRGKGAPEIPMTFVLAILRCIFPEVSRVALATADCFMAALGHWGGFP